jgi:hypothetical protein
MLDLDKFVHMKSRFGFELGDKRGALSRAVGPEKTMDIERKANDALSVRGELYSFIVQ